ncbi:hypothetical protein CUMW_016590 [Citrus unshiu]|nr:hypothetical protein CUMW_016590 [Citrus unshiu]
MSKHIHMPKKETEFALAAIMEIPSQYIATIDLQLLAVPLSYAALEAKDWEVSSSSSLWKQLIEFLSSSSHSEQRIGYHNAPSPSSTQHSSQIRQPPLQTCYDCGLRFELLSNLANLCNHKDRAV